MKNILRFTSFILIISSSTSALAYGNISKGNLTIEPIVGYERVQSILPTPHTSNRLFYGARANWGPQYLSLEAEVTQSKEDETYNSGTVEMAETSTNYKLGLRSAYNIGSSLRWYLRAGASARESKYERTEAGVTTTQEPATYVSPYAGSGLSINMLGVFSLNAGITAVFTNHREIEEPEYQSSLGFSIRI